LPQAKAFLNKLWVPGTLAPKDFGNALRLALASSDWLLALELLADARRQGSEVDVVKFNMVLGTCVSALQMQKALELLAEMEELELADAVAYNTLIKGYARLSDLDQCFELRERMTARGVAASQVTHGILLNACVVEGATEHMARAFECVVAEKCPMNTVLYTTLIKGFAKAGEVDKAMSVYAHMLRGGGEYARPDLITYSVLIKANCDASRLEDAIALLGEMQAAGMAPDEIIYNNLLAGCALRKNAPLGERLYSEMTEAGVRPSNVSFSVMIRLFSECRLLDKAVAVLERGPKLHGVVPEERLFVQLVQCCVRQRQGRRAVQVYKAMLEHVTPEPSSCTVVLRSCSRLNMFDTAAEVLQLTAEAGHKVEVPEIEALLEIAVRKKKAMLGHACVQAAERLGLCLDAVLLAQLEE